MGMHTDAVAAWEVGEQPIGPVADRLLRLLAARRLPRRDELPDGDPHLPRRSRRCGSLAERDGWSEAA